jgi:glycosyltransferase involved in cell wall biosynthesis
VPRLALDYVSPLPPVRSGIADYSADLLPELAATCDLRLIRVPHQPCDERFAAAYAMAGVEALADGALAGAHGGRLPLYHVGNNPYHREIVDLAFKHPGVVALHDVFLHHLLHERTLAAGDLDGYVEEMVSCHGWVGGAVALAPRWCAYGHAPLFTFPVHRRLLAAQRGVLVHSLWAAERIAEGESETPVVVVPMPMPVPASRPERARELRAQLGIPPAALVLGSYGFQTPIKRTEVVIRALADASLRKAWLLVVGEASPACDLLAVARDVGVSERVCCVGYVAPEDFAPAIEACDVCVNLRYPTAGETSASLLRVFALGRPALVSDYAQFADLPDEVVVKVPLPAAADGNDEVAALVESLRSLVEAPERLRGLGVAARRLIEREHQPARAAAAIVAACSELAERPRAAGASTHSPAPAPDSPSSLTWGSLAGAIAVEGLGDWRPGERRRLEVVLRNTGFARWLAGSSGPGGVAVRLALQVRQHAASATGDEWVEDLLVDAPWVPLPRDLAPGEQVRLPLDVRKPFLRATTERAVLRIEPHVLGGPGLSRLGGPWFEGEV